MKNQVVAAAFLLTGCATDPVVISSSSDNTVIYAPPPSKFWNWQALTDIFSNKQEAERLTEQQVTDRSGELQTLADAECGKYNKVAKAARKADDPDPWAASYFFCIAPANDKITPVASQP